MAGNFWWKFTIEKLKKMLKERRKNLQQIFIFSENEKKCPNKGKKIPAIKIAGKIVIFCCFILRSLERNRGQFRPDKPGADDRLDRCANAFLSIGKSSPEVCLKQTLL